MMLSSRRATRRAKPLQQSHPSHRGESSQKRCPPSRRAARLVTRRKGTFRLPFYSLPRTWTTSTSILQRCSLVIQVLMTAWRSSANACGPASSPEKYGIITLSDHAFACEHFSCRVASYLWTGTPCRHVASHMRHTGTHNTGPGVFGFGVRVYLPLRSCARVPVGWVLESSGSMTQRLSNYKY